MADIYWPLSLPQTPLSAQYELAMGSNIIRTKMDIGPAKVRRKQTSRIDVVSVAMVLSEQQIQTLEVFAYESLSGGVRPFLYPKKCAAGYYEVRIIPQGDDTLYTVASNSNKYSVVISMEILP